MTANGWKVVMNGEGVTISSDHFQFTTDGRDSTQLGTVVTELQDVTRDNYGQYCGLSRAAEMIGERWGLLILRDLLVGPRTVLDLRVGLPRISADVLALRLREMETRGLVRRQDPTRAPDEAVYELTEYGQSAEEVVLALARWGAATLATPRPEDILTEDSLVMALRSTFLAEAARGVSVRYELRVAEVVVHVVVEGGTLTAAAGPLPDADAVIESGPVLKSLLSRDLSVADALASGQVTVTGDAALLDTFVELFRLPAIPAPVLS